MSKRTLLDGASGVFERGGCKAPVIDEDQVRDLRAKIGELAVANSFFGKKAKALGRDMGRGMVERDHPDLSIGQQCALLSIPRSSFYFTPQGETKDNLALMRLIDVQFLDTAFFGVRQMTWHLRNDGHAVNEKRIRWLMRLMGLMPIYQKPNTSKPAKGHKTYPYLLRGLHVARPNQVWCVDITYLPMRRGFLYLVAIIDWHTRMVLSWRTSSHRPPLVRGPWRGDADFCVEALNEAHLSVWTARHHE